MSAESEDDANKALIEIFAFLYVLTEVHNAELKMSDIVPRFKNLYVPNISYLIGMRARPGSIENFDIEDILNIKQHDIKAPRWNLYLC